MVAFFCSELVVATQCWCSSQELLSFDIIHVNLGCFLQLAECYDGFFHHKEKHSVVVRFGLLDGSNGASRFKKICVENLIWLLNVFSLFPWWTIYMQQDRLKSPADFFVLNSYQLQDQTLEPEQGPWICLINHGIKRQGQSFKHRDNFVTKKHWF